VSTEAVTSPGIVARVGTWRRGRVRVHRYSGSLKAGLGLLVGMIVFSFVATAVGGDPAHQNLADYMSPPGTGGHLFGTDALGRDVMAWTGVGIRTSLEVAILVVLVSATIGCTIGTVAGYFGGPLDALLMRIADIQLSVPPLVLFIAASVVISNSLPSLVLLIAIVGWVPYARLCRARVLVVRQRGYVAAARLAGRRRPAIVAVHLLPAISTEITILASLQAGVVLLWEAGLSFLGLGLQPPYVSLGFLMQEGQQVLAQGWWVAVFPGAALALLVVAFNLTGDGLRDYFSNDVTGGRR
jgi:peptide/nickel transport system permease protein